MSAGGAAGRAGAGDYVAAQSRIADLVNWLRGKPRDGAVAASDDALAPEKPISHVLVPFHWEIEFPEVFGRENPGFDAIVGNPPFLGGTKISASTSPIYLAWLIAHFTESHGNADLVSYFFRKSATLLNIYGAFGLISTNTISQGDTRATGLRFLRKNGHFIYAAKTRLKWPGDAAVVVSVIHASRLSIPPVLNSRRVPLITAFLFTKGGDDNPATLAANADRSFGGSKVYGQGFTFEDTDDSDETSPGTPAPLATMRRLISATPFAADRVFPYLGGEEINTHPQQIPHRHVICFEKWDKEHCEATWPSLFSLVETKVKPERMKLKGNSDADWRREHWWLWGRFTPALFAAIKPIPRTLVISQTSRTLAFAFSPTTYVFSHKVIVFPYAGHAAFSALQSNLHNEWARHFGSSMKDDPVYTPSDCFETFPFPENFESDPTLEAAGEKYYEFRAALMVCNDEGLTKTYNRFHDPSEPSPEIAKLRELHAAMDRAVLDAYRWSDVPTTCGFALDWLDLDDDELADTLASAPDDIRERIESADYFFPDAASACRFQAHIKKAGRGKLPWRYRWPDEVRDDVLARLLALNAERAELERFTGLPGAKSKPAPGDDAFEDPETEAEANTAQPSSLPVKKAKKASKRASKKSAPRPLLDYDE